MNVENDIDYADIRKINDELNQATKLFKEQGWPIIDVSRKSIEETAAGLSIFIASGLRKNHNVSDISAMAMKLANNQIILATESPARLRMFTDAAIAFTPIAANLDEDAIRLAASHENLSPIDTSSMLAEAKAMKLSALHPTALVIASDQLLVCDGNI